MEQLKNIVNDYLVQWDEKKLDVVICPTFTFPAPLKDDPVKLIPGISYVAVHNLTNFPAGTLHVTVENDEDQVRVYKYTFICLYGSDSKQYFLKILKNYKQQHESVSKMYLIIIINL